MGLINEYFDLTVVLFTTSAHHIIIANIYTLRILIHCTFFRLEGFKLHVEIGCVILFIETFYSFRIERTDGLCGGQVYLILVHRVLEALNLFNEQLNLTVFDSQ